MVAESTDCLIQVLCNHDAQERYERTESTLLIGLETAIKLAVPTTIEYSFWKIGKEGWCLRRNQD